MSVLPLSCSIQTYAWGKIGLNSAAARLMQGGFNKFLIDPDTPYAELWMGTHSKGPNYIKDTQELLSTFIEQNPQCLGKYVMENFPAHDKLPFLFKVLSVNKSLSIQAHPSKDHAVLLHSKDSKNYPDDNHKPEMAIALTDFEGLCGFRPYDEIKRFFEDFPELRTVVGTDFANKFMCCKSSSECESLLKTCFHSLMECRSDIVEKQLNDCISRFSETDREHGIGELVTRLNKQFPGDVGCFCAFFFNHIKLSPGQAMFLAANIPHAYLAGDCLECMACSDNVVRAGLTPKFKDVGVLCEMLNYSGSSAEANVFKPVQHPKYPNITVYNPPIKDFAVMKLTFSIDNPADSKLISIESASIVIVTEGCATCDSNQQVLNLVPGSVLFVPADLEVCLKISSSTGLTLFRAYSDN